MIYRRCGCRDAAGKTYPTLPAKGASAEQRAKACPQMKDSKHGTWGWQLFAGFDPVTGKKIRINKSFATLKEAQAALNAAKVAKDQHKLQKPTTHTLATYAEEWLPRRQTTGKRPLAPTTAAGYRRYIEADISKSALGKKKLSEIRRSDVVAFLDTLTKAGRGPVTVNRILATVQAILTAAVKDEIIVSNVARGIEGPTVDKTEKPIWEPHELAAFLAIASEHRLSAAFELALHASLRRGELCGLRWQDVDLERGVATIRNNRVLVGGTKIMETTPKTDSSAAEVELSESAVTALEAGGSVRILNGRSAVMLGPDRGTSSRTRTDVPSIPVT